MHRKIVALAFLATSFYCGGALADGRHPNADERTAIESALKAAGYASWGKIELDDKGHWDVDDAVGSDGKKYELDLAASDLKIIKKELDND
ncbi:PepSY domain-containing protein [Hyphomicrobium sp.]|uniref:PepSY domain-containing protein n=1 Tax=Hyphomicrobium sp. TaxID=82 RepID=UPI002E312673|nr:PepSY domain-containing protein [Hyphomicrobium sp.]HEX2840498.1 PepSY domain-containing protein [Hyphomicrobium sp.]